MMRSVPTTTGGVRTLPALLAGAALVLAACDSSTTPTPPVLWEAEIAGNEGYEDITGEAGIEAGATVFAAGIEIAGAEPDAEFTWRVAEGSCAEPGDAFGSAANYGALEADEEGEATATATVSGTLASTGTYHVYVIDGSGEEDVVAACGDFSRT